MESTVPEHQNNTGGRAFYLLIFGAFVFLAFIFVVRVLSPSPPVPVKARPAAPDPRRVQRPPPPVFDSESYYRTIIDNNLFRPLGWSPPRLTEPYRLIGTVLPRDENTPPSAIIQTTAGNQKNYIVSIGEPLDASTEVVSIEGKAVTLETDGQRRTLRLTATHYLNPVRMSRRVVSSRRPIPQRPPQGVRRTPPPTRAPTVALSQWQTREGEVIRIGDARLKNPAKWGLQRRSRVK